MEKKDYNATIVVSQPANEVFKSINSVSKWWTENIEGDTENLNGVFTIHFSEESFVTHQMIEVVTDKKVVSIETLLAPSASGTLMILNSFSLIPTSASFPCIFSGALPNGISGCVPSINIHSSPIFTVQII